MRNKHLIRTVALLVVAAFTAVGCETTGQTAATGAVLGGIAGGIIGHQSGEALAGAAIGAAIGGLAGWGVGKWREKKLANKAQVEQEVVDAGGSVEEPTVKIEKLKAAPGTVKPGQNMEVQGVYTAYGPIDSPPTGTMRLMRDGQEIGSGPIEMENTGRAEFTRPMTVPEDLQEGTYIVEVEMKHGNSVERQATTFQVA